ncbi:HEAT repeat domain-containing protein [Nitrosopumilus maritimus]|nr:HEAT repeat domain-containing protein [Nitrosopumilus maritimus]
MSSEIGLGLSLAEMIFKFAQKSFKWNWNEYRTEIIDEFGAKYPESRDILIDVLSKQEFSDNFKKLSEGSVQDFLNLLKGLENAFQDTEYKFDSEKLLTEIKQKIEMEGAETSFQKIMTAYNQKILNIATKLDSKMDKAIGILKEVHEQTVTKDSGDQDQQFQQGNLNLLSYLKELTTKLEAKPPPEHKFGITFSDENGEKFPITELHSIIKSKRKVILKGAAGSGKSNTVTEFLKSIVKEKVLPVFIPINGSETEFFKELEDARDESAESRIDKLLKMSSVEITVERLKSFEGDVIIVIDGINEFKSGDFGELTEKIIQDVGEYVRQTSPHTYVLLTDRMDVRGALTGWNKITLNPLSEEEIRKNLDITIGKEQYELNDVSMSLLSRPFFLNIAMERCSASMTSESSVLNDFFKERLKMNEEEMKKLAKASFFAYQEGSVSFELKNFVEITGQETFDKLLGGGAAFTTSDTHATFSHQLLHDFLVSEYLASHPENWDVDEFDIATLESSSLESIHLVMQQIENKELADRFLLEVYDWNWKAAIASIILNSKLGINNHSEDIVTAMLVLVAQKQFDNGYETSESAKNHLGDYEKTFGEQLTKANNLKELIDMISVMKSESDLFDEWKQLFTIKRDSEINDETLKLLKSDNSLIGWTASNVLRECNLSEENQKDLRDMYDYSDADVPNQNTRRWRIIHPLGKCPSEENKKLLFIALETDPYHWVRYGAARALVEMAAITEDADMRKDILDKLGNMASKLRKNILDEIGKTVFYRNAYGQWDESVIPLLEKVKESKSDHVHDEDWEERLSKYKKGEWKS